MNRVRCWRNHLTILAIRLFGECVSLYFFVLPGCSYSACNKTFSEVLQHLTRAKHITAKSAVSAHHMRHSSSRNECAPKHRIIACRNPVHCSSCKGTCLSYKYLHHCRPILRLTRSLLPPSFTNPPSVRPTRCPLLPGLCQTRYCCTVVTYPLKLVQPYRHWNRKCPKHCPWPASPTSSHWSLNAKCASLTTPLQTPPAAEPAKPYRSIRHSPRCIPKNFMDSSHTLDCNSAICWCASSSWFRSPSLSAMSASYSAGVGDPRHCLM